jgi:hypothetical protein
MPSHFLNVNPDNEPRHPTSSQSSIGIKCDEPVDQEEIA